MQRGKIHEFFKEFQYDTAAAVDIGNKTYVYDEEAVDRYFEKQKRQCKIHFTIAFGNKDIGDVYLKGINNDK